MKCLNPLKLSNGITVNCGHCIQCRINYTTAWKLRLLYELSDWNDAMFITLTYSDKHLPVDYGLHKKDLVGFFKRLRSYVEYDTPGRRIKYYGVGEYGGRTKRPHY